MIYVVNYKDERGGKCYNVFTKLKEARAFIYELKQKGIEFTTEIKEDREDA